ncbi:hypothetical protein OMF52_14110, partial [Bordetella pertussis]
MPIALWALAAGAFGIGTTEFVIMGLLPEVGADLGVSIPQARLPSVKISIRPSSSVLRGSRAVRMA